MDSSNNDLGKKITQPKGALRRMKGFRKDEGGAMIIFGVTMFVMMLWVGGMAIDFMRFEYDRARIAYTTDRASLAAASLNQPLADCEEVARDYFDKAGLDTDRVVVKGSCNELSKTVLVGAETEVKSLFLNLLGINSMTAGASSVAEEHTQDVEISLVLDVSGSMSQLTADGTETKLQALQGAAAEFFDLMLKEENVDRVSINIIPYNMQVNAGEDILDQFNVTDEHDYSHCVDFTEEDFDTVEITSATAQAASLGEIDLSAPLGSGTGGLMANGDELQRTGHFDPYWTTINHPNTTSDDNAPRQWVCPVEDWAAITLMSQNRDELVATVNAFEAGGNTSIDIGVKWGSYFLNPNANQVIQGLPEGSINLTKDGADPVNLDGTPLFEDGIKLEAPRRVPSAFEDRPFDYTRDNTRKILVVMSDGINTTQYTLNEDYASGPSDMYYFQTDNPTSTSSRWMSHYKVRPGGSNDYFMSYGNWNDDYFNGVRHSSNNARLTYPEQWNMMGVKYFAYYYNYVRDWNPAAYWQVIDDVMDTVSASDKEARMKAACTSAKNNSVTVFTIGFEVSDDSAGVLEECATKPINFFRVEGKSIEDAFVSIAKTIQRLQLTN
jgi:Flp pilus assembly protein TadG